MNQQPPKPAGVRGDEGSLGSDATIEIEPYALEYVRRTLASTIAWYDKADRKSPASTQPQCLPGI